MRSQRAAVCLLVGIYLLAGLAYVEAVPPFEAPDEPWHLRYAEVLATGRLPSAADTYEYHHPPLYYAWLAIAVRQLGGQAVPLPPDNPYYPFATAAYLHPSEASTEIGPVRFLRTFSGLLGALVVVFGWATARRMWPNSRALPFFVGLLIALWPQWLFISHAISNDGLAAAVGAGIVYGMVRWSGTNGSQVRVSTASVNARRAGLVVAGSLGLGLGLAWLTKLTALALLPAVLLVWARRLREAQGAGPRRQAMLELAAVLATFGTVVALTIAVAPDVASRMLDTAGVRFGTGEATLASLTALPALGIETAVSFWARFGWLNVRLPFWVSLLALIAIGLGLGFALRVSFTRLFLRSSEQRHRSTSRAVEWAWALWSAVACMTAATILNLLTDQQPQGRFLFPALTAILILVIDGWHRAAPRSWHRPIAAIAIVFVLQTNLVAVIDVIPRAYAASRTTYPDLDLRLLSAPWRVVGTLREADGPAVQTFRTRRPHLTRVELPIRSAAGSGVLQLALVRLTSDARLDPQRLRDLERDGAELGVALGEVVGRSQVDLATLGPDTWVSVRVAGDDSASGETRAYALVMAVEGDDGAVGLWGATDGEAYAEGELTWGGEARGDLVMLVFSEPRN